MKKSSFLIVLSTFQHHGITSLAKKVLENATILNLENQAILLAVIFLIHNSRTTAFAEKHFLQNAIQE